MTNTTTDERIRQIRDICEKRKIKELVHFTRLDNLYSILKFGLLGREDLSKDWRIREYVFNDELRLDKHPNAVCLSIGFPNYKMFYRYRKDNKGVDWVVLSLRPEILWELDCAFYNNNAASSEMQSEPLSVHKKAESLERLYQDYGKKKRPAGLPLSFPTNPQAEVLVFEKILPSYITRVYFNSKKVREDWLSKYSHTLGETLMTTSEFIVYGSYFNKRCDYKHWPSDYRLMDPLSGYYPNPEILF